MFSLETLTIVLYPGNVHSGNLTWKFSPGILLWETAKAQQIQLTQERHSRNFSSGIKVQELKCRNFSPRILFLKTQPWNFNPGISSQEPTRTYTSPEMFHAGTSVGIHPEFLVQEKKIYIKCVCI